MPRRIIDLSTPILTGHFRWPVERGRARSYERGDSMQATWARWSMHAFTHMDTPRHFDREGFTQALISLVPPIREASTRAA